ncbi:cytochrome P450 [Salinisphaera sp. SPP-AMP-43]|uniref:cytochrome P450 n=1 Tax=Salinisphaera sp. SPP-AMP-43 TaxID=3121288 RepID=UPI003C6E8D23
MTVKTENYPDSATAHGLSGPAEAFPIAPDDATRRRLQAWQAEYGDLFQVPAVNGGPAHWIVNDPALAQQVLVRQAAKYTKGMGLDRVKILLGNGIMVSEGDFWARQRRMLQTAFRPRSLADFNTMIFDENAALAARWQQAANDGRAVEAEADTSELSLGIVLKSIFGADYARLVEHGHNPFALLTEQPERNLRFAARFHRLKKVVDEIIDTRLAAGAPHEFDFLGHLLATRGRDDQPMSRTAIIDEVMTLIVAGHETTASALAFAWHLIATHPSVAARMQAETDGVDEATLRTTGGTDRQTLAYTDRVVAETLRLYPPGWLLSRRATVDHELGGRPIAAGTQVFICPYLLHRHPQYWQQPERFDPDRFERADEPRHRLAYLPYAAGPRHCIGEHMAATEMRVHLATMLRHFTPIWQGEGTPAIESAINLRPANGIYLQLAPR